VNRTHGLGQKEHILRFSTHLFILFMLLPGISAAQESGPTPMQTSDILNMRSYSGGSLSPDKLQFIYSLKVPDLKDGVSYTNLYLRDVATGNERQMTYTADKNETTPLWHPDGEFFVFSSNRSGKTQVYGMRPDGGEAWPISEQKQGIGRFELSRDGRYLAYSAGATDKRQLFLYEFSDKSTMKLTERSSGVGQWIWNPDGEALYFLSQAQDDVFAGERKKHDYTVRIRDEQKHPYGIWSVTVSDTLVKQIWADSALTVRSLTVSDNGTHLAFTAPKANRYADPYLDVDLHLLHIPTGDARRITDTGVAESNVVFSPDSKNLMFVSYDPPQYRTTTRLHVTPVAGGDIRVLARDFDNSVSACWWGPESQYVYATVQQGIRRHLYKFDSETGTREQLTDLSASLSASWDRLTKGVMLRMSDPLQPDNIYWAELSDVSRRERWKQLTDTNPQVREMQLGEVRPYTWKSTDGKTVEGILYLPSPMPKGKMPLIVQIHGGPASAFVMQFQGNYGRYSHVYTGKGYAVFQPNYRGSTGYGELFTNEIAGDYFRQAYDDIMTGVDALIDDGIAHEDSLGVMGWSAGGHWSNWILVSTDRFKAISSGAGAVNWVSLYAQTDVQFTREFYFQGRPYDNWDHYVEVSPLTYIKNAKTPTLIHFGDLDPRIPRPQGDELYMALKKLGVPVEYIVYPGQPHGLQKQRYQQIKMEAELGWFEKWIRGREQWIDWQKVLESVPEE
jgi:dipeptidyl aminopeptidase/acylaminoacyl peptidase